MRDGTRGFWSPTETLNTWTGRNAPMSVATAINPTRADAKVTDQPDFIRPSQAASILGKNPATVRRACASGAIKAVKFGSEWLINKAAFYEQFGL